MATKYGGYMGKILWIDLTTDTTREYPFTDQERRETLGGKTLSPKTGLPTSSNCGSRFGLHLKKAGFDALILSGR